MIGAVLLVGAVTYLVYAGVRETSMYYFKIDEFLARKSELTNEGVRVAGRVRSGSVEKKTTTAGTELRFVLSDFGAVDGVPVHYTGVLPDMFAEGRDVIVEGKYTPEGMLRARSVLTSCPSKYEAEADQPHPGGAG
ncbi:MAG: cytochrome c maturation protein CcmE [Deltaproteobacteria bacterium]|nr:cytochrome c maturation protein CcmE [Deltaproteobacteria bacterium]